MEVLKTVDMAEHPLRNQLKEIKDFGNNAINNTSLKEAFATMKENMKQIANARQICIDNDITYRSYKQQAFEGAKNMASNIITPVKTKACEITSNTMNMVKNAYTKSFNKFGEFMGDMVNSQKLSKFNIKAKEVLSLGAYSYNLKDMSKLGKTYDKMEELKDLGRRNPKNPFVQGFVKSSVDNLREVKDYLKSDTLKSEVWGVGKQSPEQIFQNALSKTKEEIGKDIQVAKEIPGNIKDGVVKGANNVKNGITNTATSITNATKTKLTAAKNAISNAFESMKNGVLKGLENSINAVVKVQNKYIDIKMESLSDRADNVIDIQKYINQKSVRMLQAANDLKNKMDNNLDNAGIYLSQITNQKDLLNKNEIMAKYEKDLQVSLEAIEKLPIQTELKQDLKDKLIKETQGKVKEEIRDTKQNIKQMSKQVKSQEMHADINNMKSGIANRAANCLQKISASLNNDTMKLNQKGLDLALSKWKTVSFTNKGIEQGQNKDTIDLD